MDAMLCNTTQPALSDDWLLIQRLVARDQTALGVLYDRYASVIYALALKITRRPAEAEEVVVDSFWQIWQQADRYDQARAQVGAWIFTIARRRALDRLRAIRRAAPVAPDQQAEIEIARHLTASETSEQGPWLAEQSSLVCAALAELTPEQREAIELAYYYGLSYSEIAEHLGEPLSTIKTRIRLGMVKLREHLTGQPGWLNEARPD